MNTYPSELVRTEKHTDVVHEAGDDLCEVGAVSETKGGIGGPNPDGGGGFQFGEDHY